MDEAQGLGVEHLAARGHGRGLRRPGAVDAIADHGQAHVGEVQPDLVLASREDLHLEEGGAPQALAHLVPGEGRALRLVAAGQATAPAHVGEGDGGFDAALVARGLAFHEGQVAPLDLVIAEERDEPRPGFGAQGKGERPRGVAVETMHAAHEGAPLGDTRAGRLEELAEHALLLAVRRGRAPPARPPACPPRARARPDRGRGRARAPGGAGAGRAGPCPSRCACRPIRRARSPGRRRRRRAPGPSRWRPAPSDATGRGASR